MTAGDTEKSQECYMQATFFNTVHMLLKDYRFENGGAKLASCLGRHTISLCP